MSELLRELPAVALRGVVILPGMVTHFDVSRKRSIQAIETSMQMDNQIFLIAQRDMETDEPGMEDLYKIGVIANIKQIVKMKNDIIRVLVEGIDRAELAFVKENENYLETAVVKTEEEREEFPAGVEEAMVRAMQEALVEYCTANVKVGKELAKQADDYDDLYKMLRHLSNNVPLAYEDRQRILETKNTTEHYEVLMELLLKETNVNQIKNDIQKKVKDRVDKNQKDYILREQQKVIREELGEDNADSDIDEFYKKTEVLQASDEIKEKIKKQIERYKSVAANPSEGTIVRTYIETLLDLPWDKESTDNTDLDNAQKILDEDHYGLKDVKERIMEFLAVRNLTKKGDSPIICLVGPPGTGKTSIARSIAKALEKKYERICLGGVRDEAEIRGHRRTYLGSMPGRIVQGLRSAGVKNPLMLLDEIDKMSSDYKGDPSSAMLEVLDSEQNSHFIDHYIDMPVDLSEVLFLATANDASNIPRPLLDRMELIEISGYTANEKMHIATEHLVEKQKEKNGIAPEQLSISEDALQHIIDGYTREAGVRNLERRIGQICRKAARKIYQDQETSIEVTDANLEDYLGKEKFAPDKANETDEIGIVRGLAWTSVGGDTLEIEVNIMPGKGEVVLTGQLGDVMKESAQTGISYLRSIADQYDVKPKFFKENDIHIHIPEGAVPKDGPSAGITMATAVLSAIIKRPVRADVAMTGEITLRGRVLPIGGLKEKLLAAKTAGIKTVCVPDKNRKDVEEISEEIKSGMEIVFVSRMDEVLPVALVSKHTK